MTTHNHDVLLAIDPRIINGRSGGAKQLNADYKALLKARDEILKLREALAAQPAQQEPVALNRDGMKKLLEQSGYDTACPEEKAAFISGVRHREAESLGATPQPAQRTWIDPKDKTQKQYLPHIGEPVLFCCKGATYMGKHTGGSFKSEATNQHFNTWECHWMYLPAAHGIKP